VIYTIKKSDIEKLIKGKIKKQQIVVGFDTASKTGLAVFTVYEKYENVQLEVALKEFKSKDICDRYDEMIDCFKEFLLTKTPSRVIIEDTYLRFGNAKTFSTLSRFGMIAYVLCR
jgi:Holliday junction resolvasome RuvABC endonuclease subunit